MYYLFDTKHGDLVRWSDRKPMSYKNKVTAENAALVRNIRKNSQRFVVLGPLQENAAVLIAK